MNSYNSCYNVIVLGHSPSFQFLTDGMLVREMMRDPLLKKYRSVPCTYMYTCTSYMYMYMYMYVYRY